MTERPPSTACPVLRAAADDESVPAAAEYVSYAQMDRLHALAEPRTDSPHELTFILLSHVKELLFRMIYVDVDQARSALESDRFDQAARAFERAIRTQRVLVMSWESMNGLGPDEFVDFREALGGASGVQSFMYRTLEFALGDKDPAMVTSAVRHAQRYPHLRAELDGPSVYDSVLSYLSRRGFALPSRVTERDFRAPYVPSEAVEQVWLTIYRTPVDHPEEYRLAELLTEVAYQFSHWRATHLLVVERKLGHKPGTGGTEGVDWLRTVNDHRFFPELWSVRTRL